MMIHRVRAAATAWAAVVLLLCPLTAVAQEAGREETAPALSPFTSGRGGSASLVNLFTPTVGHTRLRLTDRVTWFPEEPVAGQSTSLSAVQQDVSFALPLWQDPTNEWSAFTRVRGEFFRTHARLPATGQPFPEALWHVQFGTTYRHQFANGWLGGGAVSVGSASDQPFARFHDLLIGGHAFLRVPQGTHNAWLFSLAYAPTSELPFPLPGAAYLVRPSERFLAAIGLPFYLRYRPWDPLTLEGSYMLLRTVHARATYRLRPPVRLFAGFDWENESSRLADRLHDQDRFFAYEKRLTAGVQLTINRALALDLTGGYVFDRFYFEGQHYSDRTQNRIDVGAGPMVSLQGQVRW
jgi:hypothetical protein